MSANLLSLNQSKPEFLLIGLLQQLSRVYDLTVLMPSNVTITPTDSARNLGLFLTHRSFLEHISSVSKSCFLSIRDLREASSNPEHSRLFLCPNHRHVSYSFQGRLLYCTDYRVV